MSEFIKRSEETRANLVMQMRDVIDSAEAEGRGIDSEEMRKLDNLEAEYQRHSEAIEVARRNEERAREASAHAALAHDAASADSSHHAPQRLALPSRSP